MHSQRQVSEQYFFTNSCLENILHDVQVYCKLVVPKRWVLGYFLYAAWYECANTIKKQISFSCTHRSMNAMGLLQSKVSDARRICTERIAFIYR